MKRLMIFAAALAFACPSFAATWAVDKTNPAANDSNPGTPLLPFKTISKGAAMAQAGDTILVGPAGLYDERITVSKSGMPGQPILFTAAPGIRPIVRGFTITGQYVSVSGLELTSIGLTPDTAPVFLISGTYGVRIVGNYIHDTVSNSAAIKSALKPCGYLYVDGNTLERIGTLGNRMVGAELMCNDSLVENNDISHTSDTIRMFGSRNVDRLNNIHDVPSTDQPKYHTDGFQGFCSGGTPNTATNATLIEANSFRNNLGPDEHGILINATANCGGTNHVIIRQNVFADIGEGTYIADTNQQGLSSAFHEFYNNTVARVGRSTSLSSTVFLTGIAGAHVINNIFVDLVLQASGRKVYSLKAGDLTSGGDYNLAYLSNCGNPCKWASPISDEKNGVLNKNPLFVSANDFHLQAGSPALNGAGPLTTVSKSDTGSGTSLIISDAHFFQPGWAGTKGDCISVDTLSNVACIVSIDYATNTAILSAPISRHDGDKVWLAKNSSGMTVSRNIGAF